MSSYAVFNYQFGKIIKRTDELSLFSDEEMEMGADTAFPIRQEILDRIIIQDFQKKNSIHFHSQYSNEKVYLHRHVIPPTDGITIIRLANKRSTTIVTKELEERTEDDYQNCIVIIDNRPGIQRILIENKKTAFNSVKQVERILQYTLNEMLHRYSLYIDLMHLQDPRAFWSLANDKRSYPNGFYKITFHLPHLNLERLRKVFDKVLVMSREVFDSDLEWSYKAQKGGELYLNEKNPYQQGLIEWMMKEVGDENIKLYSNDDKRKAIVVGRDSFFTVGVSESTIRRLAEEAVNRELFGSPALEEIKLKAETGIDPTTLQHE